VITYGIQRGRAGDGRWHVARDGAFVGRVCDDEDSALAEARRISGGQRCVRTVFVANAPRVKGLASNAGAVADAIEAAEEEAPKPKRKPRARRKAKPKGEARADAKIEERAAKAQEAGDTAEE